MYVCMYVCMYVLGALSLEQRVFGLYVRCVVWRARCPKVQRDCEGITDAHLSRVQGSTQHHRRHTASAVTATKNQRKSHSGRLSGPPRATQNQAQNRGPTGQIGRPNAVGAHAEHANAKLLVSGTQPGRTRERNAAPAGSARSRSARVPV